MDSRLILILLVGIFFSCCRASPAFKPDRDTQKAIYKFEWTQNGRRHEELIAIDKFEETEKIHVNADEESAEVDIISDFKRDFTLYRLTIRGVCFLGPLDHDHEIAPSDLSLDLEKAFNDARPHDGRVIRAKTRWYTDGLLHNRLFLSNEMANLCAGYPIYMIRKDSKNAAPIKRVKREEECTIETVRKCYYCLFTTCCYYEEVMVCKEQNK